MSKNTKKWPITRYKIKEIIHFNFKKQPKHNQLSFRQGSITTKYTESYKMS